MRLNAFWMAYFFIAIYFEIRIKTKRVSSRGDYSSIKIYFFISLVKFYDANNNMHVWDLNQGFFSFYIILEPHLHDIKTPSGASLSSFQVGEPTVQCSTVTVKYSISALECCKVFLQYKYSMYSWAMCVQDSTYTNGSIQLT